MKKNTGFTLIELMVAMGIAMVTLLAVSTLYINTKQTFNLQGMQNRLSEDGRFAISMLQRVISQAGFRPNPNALITSDRISAISNSSLSVRFNSDGTNQIGCNGTSTAAGDTTLTISSASNKLQCDTIDWITPSTTGTGNATEVVDFKVQYGIDEADTDAGLPNTPADYGCGALATDTSFRVRNCIPNRYVNTLPGGVNADQIVAVKVCLVLRTEKTDNSLVKSAAINDCSGTAITNSQNDKKLYRTFRSTIMIKNR
ncbi:PilW family protein [Chitinibacter bivalviorum]|uniref:PilW family protein n=1 Tax=Chitinibacter bivalviorum TaxID=2739434 RepID=A0A7H9BKK3_9NEIS|nr:PilW family protein [Chitinibacter bivalviorum]QLG89205.1 PilW family protein [Chitinibacter bivalviorum]